MSDRHDSGVTRNPTCPNDEDHETVVKEDEEAFWLHCYDCDEAVDWDSKIPDGANGPGTFQWRAKKRRGI